MPKKDLKNFKNNHGKSFMIKTDADMEFLIKKIISCHNNHKKSSKSKINLHTACDYSFFMHQTFDLSEKLD